MEPPQSPFVMRPVGASQLPQEYVYIYEGYRKGTVRAYTAREATSLHVG